MCSRKDDQFRHGDAVKGGRERSGVKVISSSTISQRSRSAGFEHLQAPVNVSTSRYSRKDPTKSDYRQISRCWYDLAATDTSTQTQQQRVGGSSSRQSIDSEQQHQPSSVQPTTRLDQTSRRRTSNVVDDVSSHQTGNRITSSDMQLLRADVVHGVSEGDDVDSTDRSSVEWQSRLAAARLRREMTSVELQVPRRCRSVSRTRRRALSSEMKLTITRTTTETTTITPQHQHHQQQQQQQQQHDECLTATVTTTSAQVNHASDNDHSATALKELVELSVLLGLPDGITTDVTGGMEQRHDATVTSESCCHVSVASEGNDHVTNLLIESAGGDVITDVAIDDDDTDERDLSWMVEVTEPSSSVTVERHENTAKNIALNTASLETCDDNASSTKYSGKGQAYNQYHDAITDELRIAEYSSYLPEIDKLQEHDESTADAVTEQETEETEFETEADAKMTAEAVGSATDDIDEDMRIVCDVDRLSHNNCTSDCQTTSVELLTCALRTANDSCVERAENVDETRETDTFNSTVDTGDNAAVTENITSTADDVSSGSEHIDHCHVTAPRHQLSVSERPQLKPVCSQLDDGMTLELKDGVAPRCFGNVGTRVSNNKVDTESQVADALPTAFVSTLSIDCGSAGTVDDVNLLPSSERHVTNLTVLELGEAEEVSDLREVISSSDDRRQRADDMTQNKATSVNVCDDNAMSFDTDCVRRVSDVSMVSNHITLQSSTPNEHDVYQHTQHCAEVCLRFYDDSRLSFTDDFGLCDSLGQAEFYVNYRQENVDEADEIRSIDNDSKVASATALLEALSVRDRRATVQSERRQSDVHSKTEICDGRLTLSTVSLASGDNVAVVNPPTSYMTRRSDVEVKSQEQSDSAVSASESKRDKEEVDGRIVLHDYGEMWSVFREIPLWVKVLRADVIERHNNDPRISRLLSRYPSLRPSTWMWTSPPLVRDLRQTCRVVDGIESKCTTCLQRSVSKCWSFNVQPAIERCTLVATSLRDVIE